ncbi:hypothetical protein ACFWXK_22885 [Streptomyces sp. NPDC059070]|uniref:hypothetical protein n=1 Tax=Streptomyces sp. NPDC059070 TaxID=3346713 RepID=UPI0036A77D5C
MAEANQALYDVTARLCGRLRTELEAGRTGPGAEASWEALVSIAQVWREDPELPDGILPLLPLKPQ